ncbi:MAG: formylglycine-generating enzyme family protein [Bacteroidales bacterium]|jgi:formylglycine-generating enzyme required for sulfatase activity|nr:formylglycine-generating enzyme family protein [Bacteroidales bacterium]
MNKLPKLLLVIALIVSANVVCRAYSANHYVGFTSDPVGGIKYPTSESGLNAALSAAALDGGVVYVARGVTLYLENQLQINARVIGGCNPAGDGSQKTAIGAANSVTSNMTVLDGNSFRHPRRDEKHRVATVNAGGIIENCLIRNGHARGTTNDPNDLNGHGGGVLLNGGKLYNCIIRGNVAMNVEHQPTTKSSGGGVYITSNGGEVVNCIIAFNMDDKGVGIDGKGGTSINSTIAYNTQTPTWVNIPRGIYQHYGTFANNKTPQGAYIYLDSFYIASTECTSGQYACFMAAVDMGSYDGRNPPYLSYADRDEMIEANAPAAGYGNIKVKDYAVLDWGSTEYWGGAGTTIGGTARYIWNILSVSTSASYSGLSQNDNAVWYPNKGGTTAGPNEAIRRDNYSMAFVSWWGSLAFSLWIGGCLPTEAQWEYAARQDASGTNNSYLYAGSDVINEVAWYNAPYYAHEVAKKAGTAKGLYDMSGNVMEWCLDPFGDYLSGAGTTIPTTGKWLVSGSVDNDGTNESNPIHNPVAVPVHRTSSARLLRGGSFAHTATYCSIGYRNGDSPNSCSYAGGFRSVCYP